MAQVNDEPQTTDEKPKRINSDPVNENGIKKSEILAMFQSGKEMGWDTDDLKGGMRELLNKESTNDLNREEFDFFAKYVRENGPDSLGPPDEYYDQSPEVDYETGEITQ